MDRKINKLIAEYVSDLKKAIQEKVVQLKFEEEVKSQELIDWVFGYERLVLSKDELSKRKRIQNTIPSINRCHAKRASGEQCTRKQKEGFNLCGTHVKGTPYGVVNSEEANGQPNVVLSEVFVEEIGGIVYYLDKCNNVYSTEDVLKEIVNPKIIAKYEIINGQYHIPSLGL